MTATFATISQGLAAHVKAVRCYVYIDGKRVDWYEVSTRHGTDQLVGTCSLVLPQAPVWSVPLNARVHVRAGYAGITHSIFQGYIPDRASAWDESGGSLTIEADGYGSLLAYPERVDLRWPGPVSLKRLFESVCKRRGVPSYIADEILAPDGSVILLGGVPEIDDGDVVLPRTTTPLEWLDRHARLFGARVFDEPAGRYALRVVSGDADLPSFRTFTDTGSGANAFSFRTRQSTRPMVTYWEALGARYTAADGREVVVRSIPEAVPYAPELDPPGYRSKSFTDEALATTALAKAARNVLELDYGAYEIVDEWEAEGNPDRRPGDTVLIDSAKTGRYGYRYLMELSHRITDDGFWSSMSGWSGTGTRLKAAADCVRIPIGSGIYHVGNQTMANFADPTPDGTTEAITFTVPAVYNTLTIEARAHGSNDHMGTVVNSGDTASTFEIWQRADPAAGAIAGNDFERRGSGDLPELEDVGSADYTDDSLWSDVVIPITGSLVAGDAELRLVAGSTATDKAFDDFEVTDLALIICGAGEPLLPEEDER